MTSVKKIKMCTSKPHYICAERQSHSRVRGQFSPMATSDSLLDDVTPVSSRHVNLSASLMTHTLKQIRPGPMGTQRLLPCPAGPAVSACIGLRGLQTVMLPGTSVSHMRAHSFSYNIAYMQPAGLNMTACCILSNSNGLWASRINSPELIIIEYYQHPLLLLKIVTF